MKSLLIIFILFCQLPIIRAQEKWSIYLGKNKDSLFNVTHSHMTSDNILVYRRFISFPLFKHFNQEAELKEISAQAGILLPAKSTNEHLTKGIIIFGSASDSVIISYEVISEEVRKGRSAAVSILNLFSKQEDKVEQDEPYTYIKNKKFRGSILYGTDTFFFEDKQFFYGKDSLHLAPSKHYINVKNGKIKPNTKFWLYHDGYVSGVQLFNNETCVAALEQHTRNNNYFLLKSLSYKEKLIYTAFILMQSLSPKIIE